MDELRQTDVDAMYETVGNTEASTGIRLYEETSVVGTLNESYGVTGGQN